MVDAAVPDGAATAKLGRIADDQRRRIVWNGMIAASDAVDTLILGLFVMAGTIPAVIALGYGLGAAAVAQMLADSPVAQSEAEIVTIFSAMGRRKSRFPEIIKALEALGRARRMDDGRWMG